MPFGNRPVGKALSLRDFFPVQRGQVAEAQVDYRDLPEEEMEGAPMEIESCRGVAKSFKDGCARLLAVVEAELSQGGPANLDELIDGLYEIERVGQDLFLPLIRQAAGAPWAEPLIRSLEALRDSRWHLMILQFELEPEETGPTFESVEDFRRFVRDLN